MSKESSAKYRRENLEEVRRKDRERIKTRDPKKLVACQRASKRRLRLELLAAYGGKCECCGEHRMEFLAIDHRLNDGAEERRTLRKRSDSFWRHLRDAGYPKDRYRLLCHNCNSARAWYGRCPHETEQANCSAETPAHRLM